MSPSLPSGEGPDPETLRARFVRATAAEGVGALPLTLLVPRTWAELPPPPADPGAMDGLRLVSFWAADTAPDAAAPLSIQVFRAGFGREIRAQDYLRRLCRAMEYRPVAVEPVANALADAIVDFAVGLVPMRGRLCARFYGAEVVVALASGPAARYAELAELFGFLVRAASVEGARPGGPMEPRRAVALGPALRCEAPASWRPEETPGPDGRRGAVDLRAYATDGATEGAAGTAPDGAPIGWLRLKWRLDPDDAADAGAEMAKLQQELELAELRTGPPIHVLDAPAALGEGLELRAQVVEPAAAGGDAGTALEATRLVLRAHGHALSVSLVSPAPGTDGAAWSLSRRARDIVLETLRPTGH